MINSKEDLKLFLREDMPFFYQFSKRERLICYLTKDPISEIAKYIRLLRKEEYYFNCRDDSFGKLLYLWCFRKKNILGNKLGIKIPANTFDYGLMVYHHGSIIINEDVRVGKYAKIHGENCIGNNGSSDGVAKIGDYLDLGIGAKILGDVELKDHVIIGANAVVTHSFPEDNITLVGLPARKL